MRDHDRRAPLGCIVRAAQQLGDLARSFWIKPSSRLVAKQRFWLCCQDSRDGKPFAHAARQRCNAIGDRIEADVCEQRGSKSQRTTRGAQREFDVLSRSQFVEQAFLLQDRRHASTQRA